MTPGCRSVRRRLSAFHDGELPVGDQIAVQAHVRECPGCAAVALDFDLLSVSVRAHVAAAGSGDPEELVGLASTVVSRLKAEHDQSISGQTERFFEDFHLLWAAVGAAGATLACLFIVFSIFYFASHVRPDSLSAVLNAMAMPEGSNQRPVQVDGRMRLPRAFSDDAFPESAVADEEESVFALAAVVTREGRIANLELLHAKAGKGNGASKREQQEIVDLLDTISKARFEPARYGGGPVAVNVVWLYARLTVKGKLTEPPAARPAPGASRSISELAPTASVAVV